MMEQYDFSTILRVAKQTLMKEPRQRTENQIRQMSKLMENIAFFKKYSEDNYEIIKSCCKFMTLEMIPDQNPVMQIDMEGDKFYLILQGKVAIYIRKQIIIEDIPHKKAHEKRLVVTIPPFDFESYTKGLDRVAELNVGQSFGEMALQSTGGSRTATIMCIEDCYFGVLVKKDFIQILKNQERISDIRNMGTFTQNPLVEALKFPERLYVYKNSDIKKYQHQEVVFFENSKPTHIYIIKSGEFLLSKTYEKSIEKEQDSSLDNVIKKYKSFKQKMKLKIVGQEEIIGLDQIYHEFHTYEMSCNSQYGELLRIDKSLYQNKIVGNQLAKRFAESLANIKSSQNDQRIQFISNHFENVAQKLSIQRTKQQIGSSSDHLPMHVQLKKKSVCTPNLVNSKSLHKEQTQLNDPVMKLQKIVSPAQRFAAKSSQHSRSNLMIYQTLSPKSPPIRAKQGSERNISIDFHQTKIKFHFRSPTHVFSKIFQKRENDSMLTLMTQTHKQFVHKTKCLPFLTVSNFAPRDFLN